MCGDGVKDMPGPVPGCGDDPAGVVEVYLDATLEVDSDVCVQ